jgi:hypothetical protein
MNWPTGPEAVPPAFFAEDGFQADRFWPGDAAAVLDQNGRYAKPARLRAGETARGACPLCGGSDRFAVNDRGSFVCRDCVLDAAARGLLQHLAFVGHVLDLPEAGQ